MKNSQPEDEQATFNHELAKSYIGKTLLFGISYCAHSGELRYQMQSFGEIIDIDEFLISVKLQDTDEIFTLPPILDALETAAPGEYKMRSTGKVAINPDLIGKFQVFEKQPES